MTWRALLRLPARYRWTAAYVAVIASAVLGLCLVGTAR